MNRSILSILNVIASVDGDDPALIKVHSGVITTPGCEGDYRCCALTADINDIGEIAAELFTAQPELLKGFPHLIKAAETYIKGV